MDIVQYIVVPVSLNLPPGKLAAQVGHAVQLSIELLHDMPEGKKEEYHSYYQLWKKNSYPKIVLKIDNNGDLSKLVERLEKADIPFVEIIDEGRTVVEPGTRTAIGLVPSPKEITKPVIGRLRLY